MLKTMAGPFSNWWGPGKAIRLLLLVAGILPACKPEASEPGTTESTYAGLPHPPANPFHPAAVQLGEALFFSPQLSGDGKTSCASCHIPAQGFASAPVRSRNGLKRKVPGLFHLAFAPSLFWDGREKNLESLVLKPVHSADEMNLNWDTLCQRLGRNKEWGKLSLSAFGIEIPGTREAARALSQYIRTLKTPAPDSGTRGYALFMTHCSGCHPPPLFTDFRLRKSPLASGGPDSGRFHLNGNRGHIYHFRTPALARLREQPVFYHDGRFSSLNAVIRAYAAALPDTGLKNSRSQEALESFLRSL